MSAGSNVALLAGVAASNAIETAQKAGKQAAKAAEANFKAMSSATVGATNGKRAG